MRRYLTAALTCITCAGAMPDAGLAQDVTPKVHWDRIDDVADGPGDPFPRFDNFSWRAFISLNWPAMSGDANRGRPDTTRKLGDPGPRVWETYKARYEVFAPGAPPPAAWDSYDGANPCGGAVSNRTKTLSAFSHFGDFNQAAFTLSTLANPLIDQKRMYTRYEVRFNREEFDTIVDNKWFVKSKLPTASAPGTFKDGAVEIKAAWRVLKPNDGVDRTRFYIATARVFDPAGTLQTGSTVCNEHEIALVGFHIVIKTKLRPQWIWSSFEHVDNVPAKSDEPDAKNMPAPYSFNSGGPPPGLTLPRPRTISDANPPNPDATPMQVFRLQPIQPVTMQRNLAYWALPEIRGTVWSNYMLVMTQWPTATANPGPTRTGAPFPTGTSSTLANTTMETYQQQSGASCMECHQEVSNKLGRDFVAFMSLDASDPPHSTIAALAGDRRFSGTVPNATAASRGRATPAPVSALRTVLDDEPSVKALVRMLQR